MYKKIGIAVLAVVLGLIVVKRTWIGSHLRLALQDARGWMKKQVTPEQELARLRMELKDLEKQDDKQYERVAKMSLEVEKMEAKVKALQAGLDKEKTRLRDLQIKFTDNTKFVLHKGEEYTRHDLRKDALAYDRVRDIVASKARTLAAKKRQLALEAKKLDGLKKTREAMAAELERLATALAEERQAQAENECCVDEREHLKFKKDLDSLSDRIKIMTKKRELKGQVKPVNETRNKEEDAKADKILDSLGKDNKVTVD